MNNEELLKENTKLNAIIDGYQPKIQALKDERDKYYQQTLDDEIQINELYEENERLKKEINEYKKHSKCAWKCFEGTLCEDDEKYKNLLQEIRAIAENAINGEYKTKSSDYSEGMEIIGHYVMQRITKAEEE